MPAPRRTSTPIKEVTRFRALVEPDPPPNFLWVYSFGGTQDSALDPSTDRVADVLPDEAAITAAGWHSQEASDLLAALDVGIPANRIPHYLRRLGNRTFRSWQAEVDAERHTPRSQKRRRPQFATNPAPEARTVSGQQPTSRDRAA